MTFNPKSSLKFQSLTFPRAVEVENAFAGSSSENGLLFSFNYNPESKNGTGSLAVNDENRASLAILSLLNYDELDAASDLQFTLTNDAIPKGVTLALSSIPEGRVDIAETPVQKPGVVAEVTISAQDLIGETELILTVDLNDLEMRFGASLTLSVVELRPETVDEPSEIGRVIWMLKA